MELGAEVDASKHGAPPAAGTSGREGICFPSVDGRRSTGATGQAILADAARELDASLAERILACRDWRKRYAPLIRELTAASLSNGQRVVPSARAGLQSARSLLTFVDGQREASLETAIAEVAPARELGIGTIHGTAQPVRELRVPYKGRILSGGGLGEQLERWVQAGSVEPSFAEAIRTVAENPDWLALPGRRVALFGAGAEIGPLQPLSSWGAELLALDLPQPRIWERIAAVARAGAGTVQLPIAADGLQGVDLLVDLPEALAWLRRAAGDPELALGMYAYADGGVHVRLSAAFDVLATEMLSHGGAQALAYLATPTDSFLVPEDAAREARAAYAARGLRRALQAPVQLLSAGRFYRPAYADGAPVADALVTQQGPNYALAKRLQRWRGIVSESEGRRVSFNVAPATLTHSVTKNRILAAAYSGAHHFGIEILAPETTRTLMAALLVHDLNTPTPERTHPEELFSEAAAHGGLWRAAYEPGSALPLAAVAGLPSVLIGSGRS